MTENESNFLQEYQTLCEKYQVHLDSCGCCFSPWLVDTHSEKIKEHILHLEKQCK